LPAAPAEPTPTAIWRGHARKPRTILPKLKAEALCLRGEDRIATRTPIGAAGGTENYIRPDGHTVGAQAGLNSSSALNCKRPRPAPIAERSDGGPGRAQITTALQRAAGSNSPTMPTHGHRPPSRAARRPNQASRLVNSDTSSFISRRSLRRKISCFDPYPVGM
jgi:hypothetical protein